MVGRLLEYLKSAAKTASRVVLLDFSVLLTRGTSLQSLAQPTFWAGGFACDRAVCQESARHKCLLSQKNGTKIKALCNL